MDLNFIFINLKRAFHCFSNDVLCWAFRKLTTKKSLVMFVEQIYKNVRSQVRVNSSLRYISLYR